MERIWPARHSLLAHGIFTSTVNIALIETDGSKIRADEFCFPLVIHQHFTLCPSFFCLSPSLPSIFPRFSSQFFLVSNWLVHHSFSVLILILYGPCSCSLEWLNNLLYMKIHSHLPFFCLFSWARYHLLPSLHLQIFIQSPFLVVAITPSLWPCGLSESLPWLSLRTRDMYLV